ncbi:MAG: hypothetical protein IPO63_07400 [Bacteroidetes bacterium]|nr:hypothetical protein [Bacteroidota bacterium]
MVVIADQLSKRRNTLEKWKYTIVLKNIILKFKNNIMLKQEIEELLSESDMLCVSIIVPTHRISPEKRNDAQTVKKAVDRAKEVLRKKFSNTENDVESIIQNIDETVEKIDYIHSKDGVGIFVSPNVARLIIFPFPVIEKINIGTAFDSRDLLYYVNTIFDYCVLSVSKKYIHLYTGKGEELKEVKNEDFPINYEETYEYSKPSRGTSFSSSTLKEFERDKSVLQELRFVDFLKTADHLLNKNVSQHVPLIVSGGKKEISDFLGITQNMKRIIGKVVGNYNFNGDLQLAGLSWMQIQNHLKNRNENLLSNLRELVGNEMVALGIEEILKAANEGKGLELVVEKDLASKAFIAVDEYNLNLQDSADKMEYMYENDVVEKIIRTVREKNGRVVFVDNGEMKEFSGIALKLRYNNIQH